MKLKRKVSHPDLLSYVKFEFKYFNLKNNFYYNTHVFNNFSFSLVMLVSFVLLGFFKPLFWAVGLSHLLMLLFLYTKTLNFAQGLTVTRSVPKFTRERRQIEILYTLGNETAFALSDFEFVEEFDGVEAGRFTVKLDRPLKPHSQIQIIKKITLDAGMGVKTFRPINFHLEDDLGLFDFKIQFSQESEIEVYPFVEETPSLKTSISPDSIDFGFYELAKRGDSNLFIGVRDYRHGDPVKHINWKLSKKGRKVVVNEYEKNTNTFVTFLLELELSQQLGFGESSTWETAKDLALSLATNESKKNNLIQVISNNLHIPFDNGQNQLTLMEKHFTYHEMVSTKENLHLRWLQDLPRRGQIYYFCPMLTGPRILETLQLLKQLHKDGQNVVIFVLDPYQEMARNVKGDLKLGLLETERTSKIEFARLEKEFKLMGVGFTHIRVGKQETLSSQITKDLPQLLEVK